jgi:hypothetical protein
MEHGKEERLATEQTVNQPHKLDLLWTAIETESNTLPTADEQAAKMLCRRFGVAASIAPLLVSLAGLGDRRAA